MLMTHGTNLRCKLVERNQQNKMLEIRLCPGLRTELGMRAIRDKLRGLYYFPSFIKITFNDSAICP
jgi:hypothetical protein